MADSTPKSYHTDPTLYLYTSLTAGSSHITTATSRLETILKANRIPFQALDVATDEKARMLWGRRAGKRKLPGLVRMGMLVGVNLPSFPPFRPFHHQPQSKSPHTNPPLPNTGPPRNRRMERIRRTQRPHPRPRSHPIHPFGRQHPVQKSPRHNLHLHPLQTPLYHLHAPETIIRIRI